MVCIPPETGLLISSRREQARDLLAQPEIGTTEGKRGRATLAVLLGCALRRSELAALKCAHIQQRDARCVFVDLVGKRKRVRTVPIPPFVKVVIDAWTAAVGLSEGPLFRQVRRRKYPAKTPLSERINPGAHRA
jgi:integrase